VRVMFTYNASKLCSLKVIN